MLRQHASDLGNCVNAGGVPGPAVTIYERGGSVSKHFEEYDLFVRLNEPLKSELLFPALPIIDHRATQRAQLCTSSNFDGSTDIMANADVQYFWTARSPSVIFIETTQRSKK